VVCLYFFFGAGAEGGEGEE